MFCLCLLINRIIRKVGECRWNFFWRDAMSHWQKSVRFWCRCGSRSGSRNVNGIFYHCNCKNFTDQLSSWMFECTNIVITSQNKRSLKRRGKCSPTPDKTVGVPELIPVLGRQHAGDKAINTGGIGCHWRLDNCRRRPIVHAIKAGQMRKLKLKNK